MIKGRSLIRACGPFSLLAALSGCAERTEPSAEESRQLDDAAEMLNAADEQLSDIDANALADPEPAGDGASAVNQSR